MTTTTPERLTIAELLNGISLRPGRHATRNDGVCAMEAAAWMAEAALAKARGGAA